MAAPIAGIETLHATPQQSAFSPAQIARYLQHVAFPLPLSHPRDAAFLRALHRCQIASIPYENLSIHYNAAHANSIDPQALYAKFLPAAAAAPRGRGGFCFETCVFFLHVLRGLGFTAYPASASIRIRDHFTRVPSGPFVGPRHVVNLVLLPDGTTWSTDVGFGGDGPTSPLQLPREDDDDEHHEAVAITNLGAQEVRLRRGTLPATVRPEANRVWFYEYRNSGQEAWNVYYAFGAREADAWDLQCANWWVASHPDSFQRKQVLVVKFLRGQGPGPGGDGDEVPGVVGKVMLADDTVKRNMGGKTEVVAVCRTEEERVRALGEYFGIWLGEEERRGIEGFGTELKG